MAIVAVAFFVLAAAAGAGEHRIGAGIHYWTSLSDLPGDGFDAAEDGTSWLISYQYDPGALVRFEANLEFFDAGFGGSGESAVAPMAFVLVGAGFYGGVGVGVTWSKGFAGDFSDPFFAGRIGWRMAILPRVSLDLNANYTFDAFNEFDQLSGDAMTLGVIGRIKL